MMTKFSPKLKKSSLWCLLLLVICSTAVTAQLRLPGTRKHNIAKVIAEKKRGETGFSGSARFDPTVSGSKEKKTVDAIFTTDLDGTVWFADGDSLAILVGEEKQLKVPENCNWYFRSDDEVFESKAIQQKPKAHERGKPMQIDIRVSLEHDKALADLIENEYTALILNEIKQNLIPVSGEWMRVVDSRSAYEIKPFEISAFEVTVAQFELFVRQTKYVSTAEKENGGSYVRRLRGSLASNSEEFRTGVNWRYNPRGDLLTPDEDNLPVVHVTWEDAMAFCKWLSDKDIRYAYRLPTVKEWELAADCGNNFKFPWGNEDNPGARAGNMADLSLRLAMDNGIPKKFSKENDGYALTSPVGNFEKTACGLYDMAGNVAEWCDWDAFMTDQKQGEKPYKGGSYFREPSECAIEKTNTMQAKRPHPGMGFRIVRTKRL